jgi:hypothetical protein
MTNAAVATSAATVAANDNGQQRTYPRVVTPKAIKEGKNKNGTEFVSFIGEYRRRGSEKTYTMFHTASGAALSAIRDELKEGQPIRVFGVFDEMPADGERRAKQVFRIIGRSVPREQAAGEMQQAA